MTAAMSSGGSAGGTTRRCQPGRAAPRAGPRRDGRPAAQSSTARIMSNQTGRRMVELIAHSSLLPKLPTNPLKVLLDPSGHP